MVSARPPPAIHGTGGTGGEVEGRGPRSRRNRFRGFPGRRPAVGPSRPAASWPAAPGSGPATIGFVVHVDDPGVRVPIWAIGGCSRWSAGPVPMSRHCRDPASGRARHPCTARRPRNARLARETWPGMSVGGARTRPRSRCGRTNIRRLPISSVDSVASLGMVPTAYGSGAVSGRAEREGPCPGRSGVPERRPVSSVPWI